MRHRTIPALEGVQFHPESILTEHGHQLLRNFLDIASPHPAQSRVPAAQMVGNGIAGEAEVLAHAY
jgi:hypothetical protein